MDAGAASGQPEKIGPYRILAELGRGGMGTVYAAQQDEPVKRRVALKVIRPDMDRRDILARFELERQSLAVMNHPNIAKVLDAGTAADGRPFFVMELVKGEPITDHCDKNRLSLAERLQLFTQVCHGIQHAHHKGVVHRDLKPGNVLVEELDDRPVARIIDFGLARATNHLLAQRSLFTEVGQIIGTPEYMSPEQAEMTGADIDTRTDVYSLGVLLYELLTGSQPFPSAELRRAGLLEIQRRIREDDPPLPSRRIVALEPSSSTEVSGRRCTSAPALARQLRSDLDWVVMRCLEKDRGRRYQTPSELAADIDRYLRGDPVSAAKPSWTYVLRKLVWRHRFVAASVSVVFTTMVVALVWIAQARSAESRERRRAEEALRLVEQVADAASSRELMAVAPTLVPIGVDNVESARNVLTRATELVGTPAADRTQAHYAALAGSAASDLARLSQAQQDGVLHDIRQQIERVDARLRPADAEGWRAAIQRIRTSPKYDRLAMEQIPGLVPLGVDPASGFEEFAVVQTGSIPSRNADGTLDIDDDFALVLVLLPAGTALVGAAPDDRDAKPYERPQIRVTLRAFLIGKYEVTQAQWLAMTGTKPSHYYVGTGPPEQMTPSNPVETVNWREAVRGLGKFGLELPTEAQWEYAARAGTTTPWWTGAEKESLAAGRAAENIANASTDDTPSLVGAKEWPEYQDMVVVHGPVGWLRANQFGLFDVLGNVKELCADPWIRNHETSPPRSGDGLRSTPPGEARAAERVLRGGSWFRGLSECRVYYRKSIPEDSRYDDVGLRAARQLR